MSLKSRTSASFDYNKIISGSITIGNSFSCILKTSDQEEIHYSQDRFLGKGSYGKVWSLTPVNCTWARPIAVKALSANLTYSAKTSEKEIEESIKAFFVSAARETQCNKWIGGLGLLYQTNKDTPLKVELSKEKDGKEIKKIISPAPMAYLVIKFEFGINLSNYDIQSGLQYLNFCIAAIESLKEKIHAKNLVHSDIHKENILVESKNSSEVIVNYVDMTLCAVEDTPLFIKSLNLNIKPPEFKGCVSIQRKKHQDCWSLLRVFQTLYDEDLFPVPFQIRVEALFEEMFFVPSDSRPTSDLLLMQFKRIRTLLAVYCSDNADVLFQELKQIPDPCDRFNLLGKLERLRAGHISSLKGLDTTSFLALWDDEDFKRKALRCLLQSKWTFIEDSPDYSISDLCNHAFYYDQILHRLDLEDEDIAYLIVSYEKLGTSKLEPGIGVNRFLSYVIKDAFFAGFLKNLTDVMQLHLFEFAEVQILQRLVNEKNIVNVMDAVRCRSAFFENVGKEYLKNILVQLSSDERKKIINYLVEYRIAHLGNSKKALQSFDEWSHEKELYKQITLAFNAIYYKKLTIKKDPQSQSIFKLFRPSRQEKREASGALLLSENVNFEAYKAFKYGQLGEIARRMKGLGK